MNFDLQPMYLTLKLALLTAAILSIVAMPLIYMLYNMRSWFKHVIQACINLPLVLPPVVIGFYLLLLFSPISFVGQFLEQTLHIRLVFTFAGLLVGSVLFNVPFMVNPILSGLENLPASLAEASFIAGKSRRATFFRVLLPSIKPSLLTGVVLTIAHTIGEFGMVLMIGGKIPGKTRVASIAVYDEVESLNFSAALGYSGILVVVAFCILLTLFLINRRFSRTFFT